MGWQDRDYPDNQIHYGGNPYYANPFLKILFGSVPLGTWFGTRVRVHASLLWVIGGTMIYASLAGAGLKAAATSSGLLFGIVLLHEFGHVFACRAVRGTAEDILLWPLGGLATCRPPHRPWPTFVTVAGGPLVNLIICLVTGGVIFAYFGLIPPLNPLIAFMPTEFHKYVQPQLITVLNTSNLGYYLFWIYEVSWMLLFFNLLPMYPLDGGQMAHAILWKPLGHNRALKICCYVGMGMSILMAIASIVVWRSMLVFFIAVMAFFTCYQQLRFLKMNVGEGESDGYDLSAAWEHPDHPARKKLKKRWINKARKRARAEQAEQARIDTILAKVKDKGLHSLTWWERRALKKATERQRQQDLAERL